MPDITSNPERDADNWMQEQEAVQAAFDQRVEDCKQYILTGFDNRLNQSEFQNFFIDLCSTLPEESDFIDLLRLNMAAGDREQAKECLMAKVEEILTDYSKVMADT